MTRLLQLKIHKKNSLKFKLSGYERFVVLHATVWAVVIEISVSIPIHCIIDT